VTVEDIVEEIVGEIADEFDRDRRFITTIRPSEWIVDGRLPIEDAESLGFPVTEADEYETVAGWVLVEIGHIPQVGESFERQGYRFRVQAMRRRRIARLHVTAPAHEDGESEDVAGA
jgi:putative hemolysin